MSRKDDITGRSPLSGNRRSHAMNHSRRRWNLNLQTVKMKDANGNIISVKVSARTLKTLKKHNKVINFCEASKKQDKSTSKNA